MEAILLVAVLTCKHNMLQQNFIIFLLHLENNCYLVSVRNQNYFVGLGKKLWLGKINSKPA